MQHPWPPQHYSSHYAQAYMQQQAAAVPQQGYSLPSPYNPSVQQNAIPSTSSAPWYQPGSSRCTYKTCTFRGSPQTVEIHMMDRHLIHPAGWEKRKKQPEWDADPSLKGKPIPIQGTTVVLDTPEQLEAWIAERRRRWPSAQRVEDKKRKMEEAVARGQLSLEDSGLAGRKRRRLDDANAQTGRGGRGGRGRGAGRDHTGGRGRGVDGGWRGRGRGGAMPQPQPPRPPSHLDSSSGDEGSEAEDAPEVVSSRLEPAPPTDKPARVQSREVRTRPRPPQPKQPVRNQFASRPTLLRNLLLPEIRITVSNLSQAIRFLVDNDFLENVELRPGQANEKLIEVVGEDAT